MEFLAQRNVQEKLKVNNFIQFDNPQSLKKSKKNNKEKLNKFLKVKHKLPNTENVEQILQNSCKEYHQKSFLK
jgi:hypothetical protein